VLDSLRHGQAVPRTLLATTTAGPSGTYSLSVPRATLQKVVVSSGNANLEVDAGAGARFFVASTTRPASANVNIISPAHARLRANTPAPCGWAFVKQLNRAWGAVGGSYIWRKAHGVTSSFYYGRGQSSTLGVGISATGTYGSFSFAGTESQSTSGRQTMPDGSSGYFWEWQTEWRTALYFDACIGDQVRPNSWLGGDNIWYEASAPSTKDCVQELPGSTWSTQNEQSVTFTGNLGVGITAVGFSASAQTGYDSNADLTYNFKKATGTDHICGTNTFPFQAWRVVAQ